MNGDAKTKKGFDAANIQSLISQLSVSEAPKTKTEDFKFWKTTPVTRIEDTVTEEGPVNPELTIEQISKEPLPLPSDFEWVTLDLSTRLKDIYEFLKDNYLENTTLGLRFAYSESIIQWALVSDDKYRDWILGVEVKASKKLVGFITAHPGTLRIRDVSKPMAFVNFMCVHKKLRDKRLSPLLIKELARRCNLIGYLQAFATSGKFTPTPMASARFFHRSLNPKKLTEIGYSHLRQNQTISRLIKLLKVNEEPKVEGWRKMEDRDVKQVTKLLNTYLLKFEVAPIFSVKDVRSKFLPIHDTIFSFVVEDPETHQITDFLSFYCVDGLLSGQPKYSSLKSAFLYYMVPKDFGKDVKRMINLVSDALSVAKKVGIGSLN